MRPAGGIRLTGSCTRLRAVNRGVILAGLCAVSLAACGSSTTRTVTERVTTSGPTSSASTATAPAAGTGTGSATSATTSSSTASSTTAAPAAVYFQGAVANAQQRPSSLQLTGDGTLTVNGVQWTSWGGPTASGTGTAEYHGCNPNCASAPVHTALVSIRLADVRVCSGRSYYAGVALTMSSGRLLDASFLQRSWSPC